MDLKTIKICYNDPQRRDHMKLKAEDIFRPGAFPEYTYVSRKSSISDLPYEFRLNQAIKVSGFLTSLVGPSKMGKTILCEKVIGFERIIEISGADFSQDTDFWRLVAVKAGLALEGQFVSEKIIEETNDKYSQKQVFSLSKDKVIEHYMKNNLVLVIDDFHYAPPEKRMIVAQQLKDAIRRGFKAVVVSLPHRADDAIRQNADLSGRLSLINIEPWSVEELKKIALMGFEKLNIAIDDELATQIAVESLSSPQLMQYICLNICDYLEWNQETKICKEILETIYKYTTANFEYGDVIAFMMKGPNTRGKNRNKFMAKNHQMYDIYELIVKSIAENPPIMKLELEDVKERIYNLLIPEEKKPTVKAIRDSLNNLQEILREREDIFKVLDWKDGVLYILDPLFLFYLRWGGVNV